MSNNTESNNNTIKITDANITDPIIAKINGTDKRQLEPEYGRLRKLYDKGTFIKPQNFDLKNYDITHVENPDRHDDFNIVGLPKYTYDKFFSSTLLFEIPEMTLTRYPMRSRRFIEQYGGSMNKLTMIFNKKNKEHQPIFNLLTQIDEFNKANNICSKKSQYSNLLKPYKYKTNQDLNGSNDSEDNFSINMSFYTKNKFIITKITKTHEECQNIIDEVEGITIDQLAFLLTGGVKVSIVAAIPYIWASKMKIKENETTETEKEVVIENDETKKYWGTKLKIVAIHVTVPYTPDRVGHGKNKNAITRKVNYSMLSGKSRDAPVTMNNSGFIKTIETQNISPFKLITFGLILSVAISLVFVASTYIRFSLA